VELIEGHYDEINSIKGVSFSLCYQRHLCNLKYSG
jgi:hypothetical protein